MNLFSEVVIRRKKCCVSQCFNRESKTHRFPSPYKYPNLFKNWLDAIKPLGYETLTMDEIYTKCVVCEMHFSPDDLVSGRRGLKVTAIPCLHLGDFRSANTTGTPSESSYGKDDKVENPLPIKRMRIEQDVGCSTAAEHSHEEDFAVAGTSQQATLPKKYVGCSIAAQHSHEEDFAVAGTSQQATLPKKYVGYSTAAYHSHEQDFAVAGTSQQASLPKKYIKRRKLSILGQVNVSRAADLTPKAKKFYTLLKKWSIDMAQKQKKIVSYQDRLAHAEKLIKTPSFSDFLKYVNNPTYHFIMCQVRNQRLSPKSRRYTLDEKILALSLMKNSRKCYKLLHKIFSLLSTRTLNNLLSKIPMKSGINKHIFKSLKHEVEKMKDTREKICILVFDEMEIDSALKYNRKSDEIIGFEDNGESKHSLIADHANVFMLNGIYRHWKQPVVFSFSSGPIKSILLKIMIKKVIEECFSIGLDVVATVCDQGATNQAAINLLLKETEDIYKRKNENNPYFGFTIQDQEVIPLFDIPHLFKGIRNNLLNKNLHFKLHGQEKIAKWTHIVQFYNLDNSEPSLRLCQKLTDSHVYPSKIKKMKVKNCTQVFSHTGGSLMERISAWDIKDNFNLPRESEETADLIIFLDNLFDSFNVSRFTKVPAAKPLKCPVTKNSPHERFWIEAREVIDSMKFFSLKKNCFVSNPSLKNLNFTFRGFLRLRNILLAEKNFKFVLTRVLNQDSLENFFSYIRSHGVRNINPDCSHFIASFKSLVINNYMANHSPGSNCLKDVHTEGLDNLRSFLTGEIIAGVTPLQATTERVQIPNEIVLSRKTRIARCTIMYMSGAIIKIILKDKTIKNCHTCSNNLIKRRSSKPYDDDDVIEARQFIRGNLKRPGDFQNFLFSNSLNYLFYLIPRYGTISDIANELSKVLTTELAFNVINCPLHNLGEKLCRLIIRCSLFCWSKSINKILKGKDRKFSTFLARTTNKNLIDPIKQQALKKWEKRRHNRR